MKMISLKPAYRMLKEPDKRLLWKFAWNFGWQGMRSVRAFERRRRKGEPMFNDEIAARLRKAGNVTPLISVEGSEEVSDIRRGGHDVFRRTLDALDACRRQRLIFGVATSVCKSNLEGLVSENFVREMAKRGALYLQPPSDFRGSLKPAENRSTVEESGRRERITSGVCVPQVKRVNRSRRPFS